MWQSHLQLSLRIIERWIQLAARITVNASQDCASPAWSWTHRNGTYPDTAVTYWRLCITSVWSIHCNQYRPVANCAKFQSVMWFCFGGLIGKETFLSRCLVTHNVRLLCLILSNSLTKFQPMAPPKMLLNLCKSLPVSVRVTALKLWIVILINVTDL